MDQTKVLLLYLRVGLQVVSARLVLLIGLALVFALFCWAMARPEWERIACATIFALLVFLPCVAVDRSMSKARAVISPSEASDG